MSVWDFIREAYLGTYTMLMQNWRWLFIVAALIVVAGLLLSVKDAPMDEQSALSESEMELLADFRTHPDVAWARGEVGIDNPS